MSAIDDIADKVVSQARRKLPRLRKRDPLLSAYTGERYEMDTYVLRQRLEELVELLIDEHVPPYPEYFTTKTTFTTEWVLGILNGAPELLDGNLPFASGDTLGVQIAVQVHFEVLGKAMPRVEEFAQKLGFDLDYEIPRDRPSP